MQWEQISAGSWDGLGDGTLLPHKLFSLDWCTDTNTNTFTLNKSELAKLSLHLHLTWLRIPEMNLKDEYWVLTVLKPYLSLIIVIPLKQLSRLRNISCLQNNLPRWLSDTFQHHTLFALNPLGKRKISKGERNLNHRGFEHRQAQTN